MTGLAWAMNATGSTKGGATGSGIERTLGTEGEESIRTYFSHTATFGRKPRGLACRLDRRALASASVPSETLFADLTQQVTNVPLSVHPAIPQVANFVGVVDLEIA